MSAQVRVSAWYVQTSDISTDFMFSLEPKQAFQSKFLVTAKSCLTRGGDHKQICTWMHSLSFLLWFCLITFDFLSWLPTFTLWTYLNLCIMKKVVNFYHTFHFLYLHTVHAIFGCFILYFLSWLSTFTLYLYVLVYWTC